MKVAILTLPARKNIGGIMQAFALQYYLKKSGCTVKILNYKSIKNSKIYLNTKFYMQYFIRNKKIKKESECFVENKLFIKNFLNHTDSLYSNYSLSKACSMYDLIVVGSDQVWRPKYVHDIFSYFLDFKSNCRKMSYAASFGVDDFEYTSLQKKKALHCLKSFSTVSVREDSAVRLCKEYLDIESSHVLDPVFLNELYEYEQICSSIPLSTEKYFVSYALDSCEMSLLIGAQIEDTLGLRCIAINATDSAIVKKEIDESESQIGPKEWLATFRDSTFIITDSFHGMAFSIIMKKQFYVINNKKRGTARFTSVLGQLGLLERLIDSKEMSKDLSFREIDYDAVNRLLEPLKNSSKLLLRKEINA